MYRNMQTAVWRRVASGLGCVLAWGLVLAASAAAPSEPSREGLTPAQIDTLVERTMAAYPIPGIAVGVVAGGQLVYAKGFGVRARSGAERVDADSLFGIGSNTKAFTAAALALLVDEGKLGWDDRVIDHLPDFRMWDPWVTREFTIRDLLTHRSGLNTGAGDLMFVPQTDFSRAEMIRGLRHLKPVSSFRAEFAYDNLLYAVAGEIVPAVTGKSWEDFVGERILGPLGMDGCAVSPARSSGTNRASPHVITDGKPREVPLLDVEAVNPAGSIVCSVNGIARWVETQLANGALPDASGARLFSKEQSEEMWRPQTFIPVSDPLQRLTRTHFTAYGFGWVLEDYQGYLRVSHNGGLPGMVTHVAMLPELGVGVIVLTNQMEPGALPAIALPILDAYAGAPARDWLALVQGKLKAREAELRATSAARAPARPRQTVDPASLDAVVGRYVDAWRGEASIVREGKGLVIRISRTEGLTGPLEPVAPGLFIARWTDRTMEADAYVRFEQDFTGKVTGFRMQAVSDLTDFSYDFEDLDFRRRP